MTKKQPPASKGKAAPKDKPSGAAVTYQVTGTLTSEQGEKQMTGQLTITEEDVPPPAGAPVILKPPSPVSVQPGDTVTLFVYAAGTPPLAYEWLQDGVLQVETTPSLTRQLSKTTVFEVTVRNAAGAASAPPTTVEVVGVDGEAPVITAHPLPTTVPPGGSATLHVAATGTPPLEYQWLADEQEVPGASDPDLETGPLEETTDYAARVTNDFGTVLSNLVTVTVETIVPPDPPSGMGLTYVRTIALPPLYMAFAYGDCTGRVVDGKTRLLFTGEIPNGGPVYEVEVTDAPVATFVQQWLDPYKGKRGTWVSGAQIRQTIAAQRKAVERPPHLLTSQQLQRTVDYWQRLSKRVPKDDQWVWVDWGANNQVVNGGHYYHPELDLFYVTYCDTYNVANRPDHHVVAMRLHPDGTNETYGPFRLQARNGDGTVLQSTRAISQLRPHPVSGKILGTTTLTSGSPSCPWGANLVGGGDWPTPATEVGPEANIVNPDCYLWYYYMEAKIGWDTGEIIDGSPLRSQRRRIHPYIFEAFPPPNQANAVDPTKYGGIGSWGDLDFVGGLEPLDDRVYFIGSLSGSPIQDPTNPEAGHVWYANSINPLCNHGFLPVPQGITGPCSRARFPWACVYPWSALNAVKAGQAVDWQQEPLAESNLEVDFGIVTAPGHSVGNGKSVNGGFFRPDTRDYFIIAQGADQGQTTWGVYNPLIHQFKVA